MLELDHVAITVSNLEESIEFYKHLGYQVDNQFEEEDYRWANLKLGDTRLELFEPSKKELQKISHIAYSFTENREAFQIVRKIKGSEEKLDVFYGT